MGVMRFTTLAMENIGGGAGTAIVIQCPNGKTYMVDTGLGGWDKDTWAQQYNCGRDAIAPFLAARGITKLDGLIVSHAHADHFGGFVWMWNHFPIDELMDPGYTLPTQLNANYTQELQFYDELRAAYCAAPGHAYRIILAGDTLAWDDELKVEILSPPAAYYDEIPDEAAPGRIAQDKPWHHLLNANATALRITHGKISIFIVGDIQKDYLLHYLWPRLTPEQKKCGICVLPAHGIHSSAEEVAATRPQVAIASLWMPWAAKIPANKLYGEAGACVYATGAHGNIEIVSNGDSYQVVCSKTFLPEDN